MMKEKDIVNDENFSKLIAKLTNNSNVSQCIDDVLNYTINYYDAGRAYVFDVDRILGMGCNTYEVCATGVNPEKENLQSVPYEIAPRWIKEFCDGGPILLNDIEDLKDTYASEYAFLKKQDIKSLMAMPFNKNGVGGCVGVDNPQKNCQDLTTLKNVAYIVMLCLIEEQLGNGVISSLKNECVTTKDDVFVKVFGKFEINTYVKNYNVDNVSSKQCLLFFLYLLVNRHEDISIDRLAKAFWPNQEIFDPYNYIKNIAFRARKIFKNVSGKDMIIAKNGSYAINDSFNIITDYEIIDELYAESKKILNNDVKMLNYLKIIEIYDNDMFSDFSVELWMIPAINSYKLIYIDAVDNYSCYLFQEKKYDEMLKISEKSLKIDHNVYKFHYYTILAYLGKGERSIAQSYLNGYREVLSKEELNSLSKLINSFYKEF